jgi:hypothetical protein
MALAGELSTKILFGSHCLNFAGKGSATFSWACACIVRVIEGSVLDVAVDIRPSRATSSMQDTFNPCLFSMLSIKIDASKRLS